MSRAWDEFAAAVFDIVPAGTVFLLLLLFGALTGALWYFWPAWVPTRLPRWRWRRRGTAVKTDKRPVARTAADQVVTAVEPQAPADLTLADRLAAEGRYAEAIRQRLRITLGELVAARLVPPQPGWTAAELASIAADQRPAVAAPLGGATHLFAEIWYGDRPAAQAHDQHMRTLTDQVRAAL